MTDEAPQALFFHPRNVSVGAGPLPGRILYVKATVTASGDDLPAGYALPGGERTTDPQHAQRVAEGIYALTQGAAK